VSIFADTFGAVPYPAFQRYYESWSMTCADRLHQDMSGSMSVHGKELQRKCQMMGNRLQKKENGDRRTLTVTYSSTYFTPKAHRNGSNDVTLCNRNKGRTHHSRDTFFDASPRPTSLIAAWARYLTRKC